MIVADHATYQPQDFMPGGVFPTLPNHLSLEFIKAQILKPLESLDDRRGAEVLQERSMDETVQIRTKVTEDEIAFAELVDHLA